jgi:putative phosphoribosyl transferase
MEDGTTYLDQERISNSLISSDYIAKEKLEQIAEIKRRTALYRSSVTHSHTVPGTTTILLDDGAATGATVIAAARWIRKQYKPGHFIIALPVAPKPTLKLLRQECDSVEAVITPSNFHSVGQYYEDFNPVTDVQVMDIIRKRNLSSL